VIGYWTCETKVIDDFNGTTKCFFTGNEGDCDWRNPNTGGGGSAGADCTFFDAEGNCLGNNDNNWGF